MTELLLRCPHCGNDKVPNGATVCEVCKAEVRYGATVGEASAAGFGLLVVGWFVVFGILVVFGLEEQRHKSWFYTLLTIVSLASFAGGFMLRKNGLKDRVHFIR
jgi:uncharacterized protein (DUF983 family)